MHAGINPFLALVVSIMPRNSHKRSSSTMRKIRDHDGVEILTYHPKSGSDLDPIELPGANLARVEFGG